MFKEENEIIDLIEDRILEEFATLARFQGLNSKTIHQLVNISGRAVSVRCKNNREAGLSEKEKEILKHAKLSVKHALSDYKSIPGCESLQRLEELTVAFAKIKSVEDGGPYGFDSC